MALQRSILALALGSALSLSGCGGDNAPAGQTTAATAAPAAVARAQLGSFGFDVSGMDRSVAAGDNFFDFANGQWVQRTGIPADRSSFGSFNIIYEKTLGDTRAILEEATRASDGDARRIGDYYAAFMDEAGIEARGVAPVQPQLQAIAAIADRQALARTLGASLRADVDLLNATNFYTPHLFGVWVSVDLLQPDRNVPYLVQGGLGMPDRDFYLEGGRMAELRTAYEGYVARLLELSGDSAAAAKAARIVALETRIARAHATQEETNDVEKGANAWKQSDLASKAPGMDWAAFLDAAGLSAQQDFIVWQPRAVAGLSKLVASEPLDTWKEYLAFHALDEAAPYLPKAFADAHFAFHGTAMSGTPQQSERWKRAVSETNNAVGEAVGKLYVERHFDAATKARADEMARNIIAAFAKRIDALEWMSPQTKAHAQAKVAGLKVGMGYPDKWRDYGALEVKRDDALGNAQRAALFEYRRNIAKLGQPVDRGEWAMLPQTINAMNVLLENRLVFPAAILQPPFFDPAADDAVNYGAIGAVIGHEISHGFDNAGALFDETGRLHNWWTAEDLKQFNAAGDALAAQFSSYAPFPGVHVNGRLTLGENIADVAGLATAHDAYRMAQQGKPAQDLEGFTPDQRFFLGFAQAWRSKMREQALRNSLLTNVHAPGQFRTLTVRNLDAWYPAFGVKEGQALYLAPDKRVKVW
ncbi:M13 family metallopeptidase [Stenotrophomonas acidaminiphila]|uniref:M13 family metallopeptidase n=1 Tax=Stenotrophomonas acidaminiphila TaxID=128780 RepID=UPI0024ADC3F8|nr:M13 family metallopeptidase [Stenotrophomonas acidaminiphila]WHL19249.1 M13 family metallopeptidase [Stenotrophomonas acidaminiphila]